MSRSANLVALRQLLNPMGFAGMIVGRSDEFQGEYVAPHAARLEWLTGFTGSAGTAIVLGQRAAIFVDGRYVIQVRNEVDAADFTPVHMADQSPQEWLAANIATGERIAFDPWLLTRDQVKSYMDALAPKGARLVALNRNPIDAIWHDRPQPGQNKLRVHPIALAGQDYRDKLAGLAEKLRQDGLDAAVLTDPAAIMWALNLRGSDVEYTPIGHAFALLQANGDCSLFVDSGKVTPEITAHLDGVRIAPFGDLLGALNAVRGQKVALDRATCAHAIAQHLEGLGAKLSFQQDITALPKAQKNQAEQAGTRAAHERDGVAMVRFLHWLDQRIQAGQEVDELTATAQLEGFRARGQHFAGLSFATIAGSGPNGAIVHYRSQPSSNRVLGRGEFFLLDSGAQYLDGTTDITRTIAIGEVSDQMKEHFTLVLKGHIALASAIFPPGTTGGQLDVLARAALWARGLDFDHGTGHGVGSYLSVHEGPQSISRRPSAVALAPGMILSNEPGYYKEGAYGIRIENLVMVQPVETGGERPMLGFETLTLAPIDRNAIAISLLDDAEKAWVDAYHRRVLTSLGRYLDQETGVWLERMCAPISLSCSTT